MTQETLQEKRRKVATEFASRAGVYRVSNSGNNIFYEISAAEEQTGDFTHNKVEDVKQSVERRRIDADEILSIGEQYLYDGCLYICTAQSVEEPWRVGGSNKRYTLVHDETIHGNKPGNFYDRNAINRNVFHMTESYQCALQSVQ